MRLPQLLLWLLAFVTTIHAFAIPTSLESFTDASQALFKRKGGGGGSSGGGSSGGGSSGGGSSGGSSGGGGTRGGGGSTSGSGSSGSSSGSTGKGSPNSNTGGSTTTGSGTPRSYGGAYGGGATTPYTSGSRSVGGITPYFLGGAALGIFPGLWLYGAYAYPYSHPYTYRNNTSNQTQTLPATCLCEQYLECGCDDNNSTDYANSVANNQNISRVSNVNGTQTLVINGTLDNGTTSSGGTDDPYGSAGIRQAMVENSGFWVVIAGVLYSVCFM